MLGKTSNSNESCDASPALQQPSTSSPPYHPSLPSCLTSDGNFWHLELFNGCNWRLLQSTSADDIRSIPLTHFTSPPKIPIVQSSSNSARSSLNKNSSTSSNLATIALSLHKQHPSPQTSPPNTPLTSFRNHSSSPKRLATFSNWLLHPAPSKPTFLFTSLRYPFASPASSRTLNIFSAPFPGKISPALQGLIFEIRVTVFRDPSCNHPSHALKVCSNSQIGEWT